MKSACRIEVGRNDNEARLTAAGERRAARTHGSLRLAVYGSRPDGHAKVLIDLIGEHEVLVVEALIDDFPENASRGVRGLTVRGTGADLTRLGAAGVEGVLLGFGDAQGRLDALGRVRQAGLLLPALVHCSAQVSETAAVGEGAQVLVGAYIGPDARVSEGALINTRSIVEHDVVVGAGAVVGPGAILAGRSRVGEAASISTGACVLPDRWVGDGAVVAAGAVVTRNVGAGEVVAGVPARELRRERRVLDD
jgi:UDP-perosamine 4-acetyltransferase